MNNTEYVIALREMAKVGPKTFRLLIDRFGTAEGVFSASLEEISQLPRVGERKAEEILRAADGLDQVRVHLGNVKDRGIDVVTLFDRGYPKRLKDLEDAPPVLYLKGSLHPEDERTLAIVGTHRATDRGREMATKLGRRLACCGITVVSGLALGIDTAGHRGALEGNGRTIAVLGSGPDQIYPRQNMALAERITRSGAILSECAPDVPVSVGGLMARNRIVTGLSQGIVVVEALINSSGTMDAVERAKRQRRPVYVVRWEGSSEAAEKLIADGAIPLESKEDVEALVERLG